MKSSSRPCRGRCRQSAGASGGVPRHQRLAQGRPLRPLLRLLQHPDRHVRGRAGLPPRNGAGIRRHHQARRQAALRLLRGHGAQADGDHAKGLRRRVRRHVLQAHPGRRQLRLSHGRDRRHGPGWRGEYPLQARDGYRQGSGRAQGGEDPRVPGKIRQPVRGRRARLRGRGDRAEGHPAQADPGAGCAAHQAGPEPAEEAREHPAVPPPDMTPEARRRIEEARRVWEARTLTPARERSPQRPGLFATSSGAPLPPVHTPADTPDLDYLGDLGFPGEFPYTRGVQPTMYRGRFWTMRQYAGFGSAAETNHRYRYLRDQGQTGLSVAFDLPTQMGYDADHDVARSEAGKVGVAISSLEEMQDLFDGIPLDRVSTSMTINATAAILLCLYIAVGERQGVGAERLSGTVQNDILKEYVARGTYIFPPAPSMRLITDTFAFCKDRVPRWNSISISGYHMREAGSTAAQEVAFTLANGIAYVTAALEAGLRIDEFAPQLSFFFTAHNLLLEEVAKYRAARRLWARIMRDRFGARDPRSLTLRFHVQTAGSMLTAQQPENNIVRVTLQALAAVLGGCQSLHTNSMDEALALPTEQAVRIALRTQQILAYESGVADTADPLGGSYAIERLTRQIEEEAETY